MNSKEASELLNNRSRLHLITTEEVKKLKESKLVIVFSWGNSDICFVGNTGNEISTSEIYQDMISYYIGHNNEIYFDEKLSRFHDIDNYGYDLYEEVYKDSKSVSEINYVKPILNKVKYGLKDKWSFETIIPHEVFNIKYDLDFDGSDKLYCEGIIFSTEQLYNNLNKGNVMNFTEACSYLRNQSKKIEEEVRALKSHGDLAKEDFKGDKGEIFANLMLSVRHLEDARMRLGKAIQYHGDGISSYDK